jgi:hypothetical protein
VGTGTYRFPWDKENECLNQKASIVKSVMNEDETKEQPEKIVINNSSDFNLYAAYLVYSKAWADNSDETTRQDLNSLMHSLQGNELGYPAFYRKIDQYRDTDQQMQRPSFKAKKKRAWRKSEAKRTRISRHKN